MNRIDVREIVEQAVGGEWEAFCRRHPALSQAVDRRLIIEQCLANMRQEPEFVETVREVELAGLAQGVLQDLVLKLVRGWMRLL